MIYDTITIYLEIIPQWLYGSIINRSFIFSLVIVLHYLFRIILFDWCMCHRNRCCVSVGVSTTELGPLLLPYQTDYSRLSGDMHRF